MKIQEEGMLLRIFLSENDKYHGKPLYEAIVEKAQELELAGATVLRGIMGFGAQSHMHTAKILRLADDLPLVVEIVDTEENLKKLTPFFDETMAKGLVTLEKVKIVKYRKA